MKFWRLAVFFVGLIFWYKVKANELLEKYASIMGHEGESSCVSCLEHMLDVNNKDADFVAEGEKMCSACLQHMLGVDTTQAHVSSSDNTTEGGIVYTRWGKTTCPDTPDTELVYTGIPSKGYYNEPGSGINFLCLTDKPKSMHVSQSVDSDRAYIDAVEYEDNSNGPFTSVHAYEAICAVCYTPARGSTIMLPGSTVCPVGWTTEYYGYLMSERHSHTSASTFVCVDKDAEGLAGSEESNSPGGSFMVVESNCQGSSLCSIYGSGTELTCAVCTK